jgi:hypothetical protein
VRRLGGFHDTSGLRGMVQRSPGVSLSAGLVSFYNLSDTSDAYGTNTLTNTNGVTFGSGLIGNAATFVAASSQKLASSAPAFPSAGTSFSLAGWVKFASTGLQRLWGLHLPGTGGLQVYSRTNQIEAIQFDGATFASATKSYVQATGTWYFVSTVYDADADILSCDLNASGSPGTLARTGAVGFAGVNIGEQGAGFGYLNGQVDLLGYWWRALSQADLAALYNGGAGLAYPF